MYQQTLYRTQSDDPLLIPHVYYFIKSVDLSYVWSDIDLWFTSMELYLCSEVGGRTIFLTGLTLLHVTELKYVHRKIFNFFVTPGWRHVILEKIQVMPSERQTTHRWGLTTVYIKNMNVNEISADGPTREKISNYKSTPTRTPA